MNDADLVVDASAVIAFLVGEPFTRFDPEKLGHALITAVNLSEVLARLSEIGVPESKTAAAVERSICGSWLLMSRRPTRRRGSVR
jgi:PIN domain nuclease of toxin-antitoxin system